MGFVLLPYRATIGNAYASHKHEHFTHHRFTNVEDKDPDCIWNGRPVRAF
jgi:fatty acid desaturase